MNRQNKTLLIAQACTHTHTHTHTPHAHTHHTHTYAHTQTHVHTHAHTHIQHIHMQTHMRALTYTHINTHACAHTHTTHQSNGKHAVGQVCTLNTLQSSLSVLVEHSLWSCFQNSRAQVGQAAEGVERSHVLRQRCRLQSGRAPGHQVSVQSQRMRWCG